MAGRVLLAARRTGRADRPESADDSGPAPEPRNNPDSSSKNRNSSSNRHSRDSGASSIELVLLAPLVIVCILLIGQFAMWYQARHIAIAAAQYGARYARDTPQGQPWQATAQTQALQYARQLGGTLLQGESAVPVANGSDRGVTVTAGVPRIVPIPGLNLQVKETSEGPVECFRASGNTTNCAGG